MVPVIPALERPTHENENFRLAWAYAVRPCHKKIKSKPAELRGRYSNK